MQPVLNMVELKCYLRDFFKERKQRMKKFILLNLIIILAGLSFCYADVKWKEYTEQPKCNSLEKLVGKFIHRTKDNRSLEYDNSFMNGKWLLTCVGSETFTIYRNTVDGEKFKLYRSLWGDGNWKEWKEPNQYCSWTGFTNTLLINNPPSIIYNSTLNLKQWDHVYLNFNRPGMRMSWIECGQILMFYNMDGESCFNHAVIRLCSKHNNKYRRDIIAYQRVSWLKKDAKCLLTKLSK